MKDLQTLKDFCENPAELNRFCEEFNGSEYEYVYTLEQALIKADENEDFKILMKTMNQETTEEEY